MSPKWAWPAQKQKQKIPSAKSTKQKNNDRYKFVRCCAAFNYNF